MTGPQKVKGDRFERDLVAFMRANGVPHAERALGAGRRADQGDILGLPGIAIQAKDRAELRFSEWLAQAERQRANARADLGVVVAKRKGRPAGESYVVMTFDQFLRYVTS